MMGSVSRLSVVVDGRTEPIQVAWSVPSGDPGSPRADLGSLDSDEAARAESFVDPADRRHYVASRVQLRSELARHLEVEPSELRIGRRPCRTCGRTRASASGPAHGQPFVTAPRTEVEFSVSRSRRAVGVAISDTGPLGLDLEETVDEPAVPALLGLLHADERSELSTLPGAARATELTRLWTRKEAYLKANGTGVGRALDRDYLGSERVEDWPAGWAVVNIEIGAGFETAVAVRRAD